MAKQDKRKKKKAKNAGDGIPINIGAKRDRPAAKTIVSLSANEFSSFVGNLCSTRMDVAFIAAEMLLHMGRGQMAAQLGHNFSHLSNADLNAIMTGTNILDYPSSPTQASVVEKLFLGFVTSIANNDPALKKQRWKTAGNSDLPFIAALSFLVGNLAWQNHTTNTPMTAKNVKDAFDAVAGMHCPATAPKSGGGPWCDWMDL